MTQIKAIEIYSFRHSKDFKKSPVESAIPLDTRGLLTWVYPTGTRAWYIRPKYVKAHGVAKAQMKDSSNLRTLDCLKNKKKLKIESLKGKTLTCNRLDLLPET